MRIPAAGTVPWRLREDGGLEVAIVHRPRYDDWAWAKGKLDPGEEWAVAAVRETQEETGLDVRLGPVLPDARYTLLGKDGTPDEKVVRYWSAQVIGGSGALVNEIDEVAWLDVQGAHERLSYARDQEQLLAVVRLLQADRLDTWPLALVRHAHAVSRSAWRGHDDTMRPLDDAGTTRAADIAPVLAAYGVTRLVSSPSSRCTATLAPYEAASGHRLRTRPGLSEEGFSERPDRAPQHLHRLFERGTPAALCTHGPVLPTLLDLLETHLDLDSEGALEVIEAFAEARDDKLIKGEVLLCHVSGRGEHARVVAVERHLP
ncbi:MAG: NUDIX hydrolase [Ornithinibacter sp.]